MVDNDGYESLEEKFGIAKVDVQNRRNVGIYSYNKVYYAKEHIVAIGKCMAENPHLKNRMCFLNFINNDRKII